MVRLFKVWSKSSKNEKKVSTILVQDSSLSFQLMAHRINGRLFVCFLFQTTLSNFA